MCLISSVVLACLAYLWFRKKYCNNKKLYYGCLKLLLLIIMQSSCLLVDAGLLYLNRKKREILAILIHNVVAIFTLIIPSAYIIYRNWQILKEEETNRKCSIRAQKKRSVVDHHIFLTDSTDSDVIKVIERTSKVKLLASDSSVNVSEETEPEKDQFEEPPCPGQILLIQSHDQVIVPSIFFSELERNTVKQQMLYLSAKDQTRAKETVTFGDSKSY